jgi:hypothetical protein
MDTNIRESRQYGGRYDRTRIFRTLTDLAMRVIVDLASAPRFPGMPAQGIFSARILSGLALQVEVGGMPDDFLFADYTDANYSTPANALRERIMRFVETYNWFNRRHPRDRRFIPSVRLLPESEYRSIFWTPGQVRLGCS